MPTLSSQKPLKCSRSPWYVGKYTHTFGFAASPRRRRGAPPAAAPQPPVSTCTLTFISQPSTSAALSAKCARTSWISRSRIAAPTPRRRPPPPPLGEDVGGGGDDVRGDAVVGGAGERDLARRAQVGAAARQRQLELHADDGAPLRENHLELFQLAPISSVPPPLPGLRHWLRQPGLKTWYLSPSPHDTCGIVKRCSPVVRSTVTSWAPWYANVSLSRSHTHERLTSTSTFGSGAAPS